MKKILLLAVIAMAFASCKKDNETRFYFYGREVELMKDDGRIGRSYFEAKVFTQEWIGPGYAQPYTALSLERMTYTNAGHQVWWTIDSIYNGKDGYANFRVSVTSTDIPKYTLWCRIIK